MGDRLKGKVALVTGAGSRGPGIGNGKAAAILFAREGARVLCVDQALERAEETRRQAEQELAGYRQQLANAREESNGIIEEARKTAEQLRADIQARAEREAAATLAKAQEEIRAERDRVFQELRGEIGEIAVTLAGRVVGESLDAKAHQRLIDGYIDEVAKGAAGNGKH